MGCGPMMSAQPRSVGTVVRAVVGFTSPDLKRYTSSLTSAIIKCKVAPIAPLRQPCSKSNRAFISSVGLDLNRGLLWSVVYELRETGKTLGVRRRYPPVLNDARYTGAVAR